MWHRTYGFMPAILAETKRRGSAAIPPPGSWRTASGLAKLLVHSVGDQHVPCLMGDAERWLESEFHPHPASGHNSNIGGEHVVRYYSFALENVLDAWAAGYRPAGAHQVRWHLHTFHEIRRWWLRRPCSA